MADFFEEALVSIGAAVADVREKYEEAVWGRPVTDSGIAAPEAQEGAGFGSLTSRIEVGDGYDSTPAPSDAGSIAPPEGLSGEVFPPEPEPGPQDYFTAQLAMIAESPSSAPDRSQDMPEPGEGMER